MAPRSGNRVDGRHPLNQGPVQGRQVCVDSPVILFGKTWRGPRKKTKLTIEWMILKLELGRHLN